MTNKTAQKRAVASNDVQHQKDKQSETEDWSTPAYLRAEDQALELDKDINGNLPATFKDKIISIDDKFEIPEPHVLINSRPFLIKGGMTVVKASPKAGKTTLLKLIIAGVIANIDTISTSNGIKKVLWVDTEQSKYHVHKTFNDLLKIGATRKDILENLTMLSIVGDTESEQLQHIEDAVKEFKPDILIVDQIADLVPESNAQAEANTVLKRFGFMMNETDLSIITVIHTNKANDNSTGHLGSTVEKKASVISQVKDDNGIKTLSCTASREAPFSQVSFMYDEDGKIVPVDTEVKQAPDLWDSPKQFEILKHLDAPFFL